MWRAQSEYGWEHVESRELLEDEVVGKKHLVLKSLHMSINEFFNDFTALNRQHLVVLLLRDSIVKAPHKFSIGHQTISYLIKDVLERAHICWFLALNIRLFTDCWSQQFDLLLVVFH